MSQDELKPFVRLDSRDVYRNKWITVTEDSVIRPDGKEGIFGVVRMRSGSTVIALSASNEVYLVREYKYAIGATSLEAVSGGIDDGETPLHAAQREMEEELGFMAEKWTDLGVLHPFTTVIDSPNYMFLAEGLGAGTRHPDEGEELAIELVPLDVAVKWVMESTITHGATCTAILKAARVLAARSRSL